jgi:hypothetical protein
VVVAVFPWVVTVPSVADTLHANTSSSAVSAAGTTDEFPWFVAPLNGCPFFVQSNRYDTVSAASRSALETATLHVTSSASLGFTVTVPTGAVGAEFPTTTLAVAGAPSSIPSFGVTMTETDCPFAKLLGASDAVAWPVTTLPFTNHWYRNVTTSLSPSAGDAGCAVTTFAFVTTDGLSVTVGTTGRAFTFVVAAAVPGTIAIPSVALTEHANTSPSAVSDAAITDDVACDEAPLNGCPFFVHVKA